ncbi:ImmA/IrrE family metallo-endopeptidase [Mycobacterium heidelbergense]|uniref:Uncharacterized protein n=1 Tax=Mycobacterium heidelbergense TaxID=53376 RepID=A0A1X0DS61_MYCHE|nr:ImmA/IrrE family metallo-endopeptidase [Mycobacterium heidelbergense]MCV7051902.1 ImmA/IrrE family metallo-endopeptidase [Mycobacterium heidelbergense]ORA75049.1 hypothetical protein BST25_06030 [Mycobacterium heidelbergense]BBZ49097.1 hypothetical protein MHEI_08140 [Mycobacterium heidelbergense]
MQWYSGPEGDQRIWYEPEDIEQIAVEQLRVAKLSPTLDRPVTDLERLIEGHLRAELDLYADLPDAVLGLTEFPVRGAPIVQIDRALTEARDAEHATVAEIGRWRATLAHEASHIFLHRYLFDPSMAPLAGGSSVPRPSEGGLMRCLHRDISPEAADWRSVRRRPDWREVQANKAMAALLMPRRTFKRIVVREMRQLGLGLPPIAESDVQRLANVLAPIFSVSKQAVRIRLDSEGLLTRR